MSLSSVITAFLMASTPSKRVLFIVPLSLWKRKGHTEQDQLNRKGVPDQQCYSRQKLPDAKGVVNRCLVVAKDILVNLLIDRLAMWQEFAINDAPHIEERDQYDFGCLAFFH